jgi:hypothetical protein
MQEPQIKTVAELDRDIDMLLMRLHQRKIPGAMLELLNDDELRELHLFFNDCIVAAYSRGERTGSNVDYQSGSNQDDFSEGYNAGYETGYQAAINRSAWLRLRARLARWINPQD